MKIDFRPTPARLETLDRRVPDHHVFRIHCSEALPLRPGQFVEISLAGIGAFPVSPARCGDGYSFDSCIRRAGRVTDALYRLPEGAGIGLRGPFGNGFPLADFRGEDVLLIAGGLGMAPLQGLLQVLIEERPAFGEIILLYGSRDPELLLFRDELEKLASQGQLRLRFSVDFATELPWAGEGPVCRLGLVGELLSDLVFVPERTVAAVCGPPVLYGCVLEELAELGMAPERIFATLERRMKCGVGECCHCVTAGRYICREGPVFSLTQLRGMEGAI